MVMDTIKLLEREQMKSDFPEFKPGDTVKVHIKVVEGERERLQAFEGICIVRNGSGLNENFTLRRLAHGVGVERTLLLHSPMIQKIEVVRRGEVRRARLYYLRDKIGKQARVKEKKLTDARKVKK
jgi:large subunit ribosomal protein L19